MADPTCPARAEFGYAEPETQKFDTEKLLELTQWVRDTQVPILSLLISRNGKIVYELYTSSLTGAEAHYVMSVTKSITSARSGHRSALAAQRRPDGW